MNVKRFQLDVEPISKIKFDEARAIDRLGEAIRFRTISEQEKKANFDSSFLQFHHFLQQEFPIAHSTLERIDLPDSPNALVFKWKGKKEALKPILFMAHQDVVSVDDSAKWQFPPFEKKIDEEFIYGRGTLDDKSNILGLLEATEFLLKDRFTPERTLYFAFGQDEEIGGLEGAKKIAHYFESLKIDFEAVLDEGGTILNGVVPGVKSPVALIGIAEKGYATLKISTVGEGGHSSMPPASTAAGVLSKALTQLEENPFEQRLSSVTRSMFDFLSSEMDFFSRLAFSNTWLLEKVILSSMAKKNSTNAATRTTTAVTFLEGGTKENVLPVHAHALVNFRLLPGDSIAHVLLHARKTIRDENVKIELVGFNNEASSISDTASAFFRTLHKSICEIFPGTLVAPYMLIGATDTKHYNSLSKNIYRFLPIYLEAEDLKRIHGTDERIRKNNYIDMIRFYERIIRSE